MRAKEEERIRDGGEKERTLEGGEEGRVVMRICWIRFWKSSQSAGFAVATCLS